MDNYGFGEWRSLSHWTRQLRGAWDPVDTGRPTDGHIPAGRYTPSRGASLLGARWKCDEMRLLCRRQGRGSGGRGEAAIA